MTRVTQAHLDARRNQIIDAAWACFARKGYHQTTMQDIADEAGISAGAIYRYYPGKETVLKAINDRSQEMGRALVEEARSLAGGPLDMLEVIGRTMLSYFDDPMAETTTRINIETWPEIIRNDELRASLHQELSFWRRAVAQLLADAKDLGQLKPEVDPDSLAALFICAWEGIRHYGLVDPEAFGPERLIDLMRVLVSESLLAERGELTVDLAPRPRLSAPFGTPTEASKENAPDERGRS